MRLGASTLPIGSQTLLSYVRLKAAARAHETMAGVVMRWVPGHMDVLGNEMAHDEAKERPGVKAAPPHH